MKTQKQYFDFLRTLPIGATEIDAEQYAREMMQSIVWDYSEKHIAQFGFIQQGEFKLRPVVVKSGPTDKVYIIQKNALTLVQLEFSERISRAEIRQQIDALPAGHKIEFAQADAGLLSFIRTYCYKNGAFSVRKKHNTIIIEHSEKEQSIRAQVYEALSNYRGEPFKLKAIHNIEYIRPIVSNFNTLHNSSFSVKAVNDSILIGNKAEIEAELQGTQAANLSELTAEQLIEQFTRVMRANGYGGAEMRAKLNEFITENDDLF